MHARPRQMIWPTDPVTAYGCIEDWVRMRRAIDRRTPATRQHPNLFIKKKTYRMRGKIKLLGLHAKESKAETRKRL